ncbi:hypothetical protein J6590_071236 [Homalodisca vitripennis]|nr:hypothetical protein J6590_071236 [Homalodisca vitripennis]
MLQVREIREVREKSGKKKQDWKSGKSQGIRSQVREKSGNFDSKPADDAAHEAGSQKPWGLRRKKSGKNEKFGMEIREKFPMNSLSLTDSSHCLHSVIVSATGFQLRENATLLRKALAKL